VISALLLALALSAPTEVHARSKPAPKPAPKPQPPPEPVEPDEPEEPDFDPPEPAEPDELDEPAPPKKRGNPFDPSQPDFTEEQYGAIGLAMLCTCFCFVVGVIVLIVFLVRRSHQPAQPQTAQAPPPAAAPTTAPFHLSVFAVGMRASARQTVAQQLILAGAQADPTSAAERTQLVRELSKAVRGLEPEWTHFGYGERLDLADESAAQRSYQLAVDDFSKRSADSSLSGESTYTVMTLVLCTRRQLRGVSALDDRAQIRALLDDRSVLGEQDLMGAFIAWSLPLGGYEVLTRFPEMHAVK
jgi:hypothetical protein